MGAPEISIAMIDPGPSELCSAILHDLPEWFGIPEAVAAYVRAVGEMPTLVARIDGRDVGFAALREHGSWSVEIAVMGMLREFHRRGVGRALIDSATAWSLDRGYRLLSVKTLGPSRVDEGYQRTRRFYRAMGFFPLEELAIWGPANPCLISVKLVTNLPGDH